MSTYFVTGATGFIGGRLVRQLVQAGHKVVTLARNPAKAGDLSALGVDARQGDITDKDSLRAPMTGVDGVFHVAGWYKIGVRDISPGYQINVIGTRNVLETMRDLGIPKGVYTSTLAVFSNTHGQLPDETYRHDAPFLTEYDKTKWQAHYEVADPLIKAGLPLIIVQPGLVYGPGDTSLAHDTFVQYLKRRLPALPRKTAYCWAHVDDTAQGHILAMDKGKPGESYIIAGPPHTIIEVMAKAEQITGIPAPRLHIPPAMFKASAVLVSPLEKIVHLPETYTSEGLRSTAGVTYLGSNAKAKRELGFNPRPLEDGLRETLRYDAAQLGIKVADGAG